MTEQLRFTPQQSTAPAAGPEVPPQPLPRGESRRNFLKFLGLTATAVGVGAAELTSGKVEAAETGSPLVEAAMARLKAQLGPEVSATINEPELRAYLEAEINSCNVGSAGLSGRLEFPLEPGKSRQRAETPPLGWERTIDFGLKDGQGSGEFEVTINPVNAQPRQYVIEYIGGTGPAPAPQTVTISGNTPVALPRLRLTGNQRVVVRMKSDATTGMQYHEQYFDIKNVGTNPGTIDWHFHTGFPQRQDRFTNGNGGNIPTHIPGNGTTILALRIKPRVAARQDGTRRDMNLQFQGILTPPFDGAPFGQSAGSVYYYNSVIGSTILSRQDLVTGRFGVSEAIDSTILLAIPTDKAIEFDAFIQTLVQGQDQVDITTTMVPVQDCEGTY